MRPNYKIQAIWISLKRGRLPMFFAPIRYLIFLLFVLSVGVMSLSLYIYAGICSQSHVHGPPPYSRQLRYLTADCRYRRFGNAMFNYASLLGIAKDNNRVPVLPHDLSIRKLFRCPMLKGGFEFNFGMFHSYSELGYKSGTYDPGTKTLPRFNLNLKGFYQSWKYFVHVESQLRTEHFVLLPDIKKQAQEYIINNIPKGYNRSHTSVVGVHVRRGDMTQEHLLRSGYILADEKYIRNAMNFFRAKHKNIIFFVCTDSTDWVRDHVTGNDVITCNGKSASLDFAILASCDHMIVTVGTFGWWAAWLANGTTVYYKDWPVSGSRLGYEVRHEDYFPRHWIGMN